MIKFVTALKQSEVFNHVFRCGTRDLMGLPQAMGSNTGLLRWAWWGAESVMAWSRQAALCGWGHVVVQSWRWASRNQHHVLGCLYCPPPEKSHGEVALSQQGPILGMRSSALPC